MQVTVDEGEGRFGWLLLRASLHDPLLVLNLETELDNGETFVSPATLWWLGSPLSVKYV